jgi:hypothetical protein
LVDGTNIVLDSSTCSLIVEVSSTVTLPRNSSITVSHRLYTENSLDNLGKMQAFEIAISAVGDINIDGKVESSGMGNLEGPGEPLVTGWGASYGGSGGRPTCDAVFSNTPVQVIIALSA